MEAYEAVVLAATGDGVGPSILLSPLAPFKGPQYLFNCPEGFARLAIEHKVRPSGQLAAVFLTSLLPQAAAGLPGLLLRLAVDGHEKLEVCGPPGSGRYVHAQRHIVHWVHPRVTVSEAAPETSPQPIFQDGFLSAVPIFRSTTNFRCPCCPQGGFDSEDDPIGKRETVDLSSSEARSESSSSAESDSEEELEEEGRCETVRRGGAQESGGQNAQLGGVPTIQTSVHAEGRVNSLARGEGGAALLQRSPSSRLQGGIADSSGRSERPKVVESAKSEGSQKSEPGVSECSEASAEAEASGHVKRIDLSELSSVSSGSDDDMEEGQRSNAPGVGVMKERDQSGRLPNPLDARGETLGIFAKLDSIFSTGKLGLRAMRHKALSTLTAGPPARSLQAGGNKRVKPDSKKDKRREKRPKLDSKGKAGTTAVLQNLKRGREDWGDREKVESLIENEAGLEDEISGRKLHPGSELAHRTAQKPSKHLESGSSSDGSEASAALRNAPKEQSKQALFAQLDSIFDAGGSARENRDRALYQLGRPPGLPSVWPQTAAGLGTSGAAVETRRGDIGGAGRGSPSRKWDLQRGKNSGGRKRMTNAELVVPADPSIDGHKQERTGVVTEEVEKGAGPCEGMRLQGGGPKGHAESRQEKWGVSGGQRRGIPLDVGQPKHKRFKAEQEGNSEDSDSWKEEGAHWLLAAARAGKQQVPAGSKTEETGGKAKGMPAGNMPARPKQRIQLPPHTPSSNPVFMRTLEGVLPVEEGLKPKVTGGVLFGYLCFLGSPVNGSILLMDCPSETACQQLQKVQLPGCTRARRGAHRLTAVFHFTPAEVAACQLYKEWMDSCGDHVRHVMLSDESQELGYRATFRTLARLNLVDETIFPLIGDTNDLKTAVGEETEQVGQQGKRDAEANKPTSRISQGKKNDQVLRGGLLARVLLRSEQSGLAEVDELKGVGSIDVAEIQAQVLEEQPALVYWRAGGSLADYERKRDERKGDASKNGESKEEGAIKGRDAAGNGAGETLGSGTGLGRTMEQPEGTFETIVAEPVLENNEGGVFGKGNVLSAGIGRDVTQAELIYERQLAEQQAAMQAQWHSSEQPTSRSVSPEEGESLAKTSRAEVTAVLSFPRVVFLGTGSAEPSKYRGGSAMLLSLSSDSALLMDCGEGAAGQLARTSGRARARGVARSVRALWISHKHADHCLGALGVLQMRGEGAPELLVVGPVAVQRWLEEVGAALAENGQSLPSYTFRHCRELGSIVNQLLAPGFMSNPWLNPCQTVAFASQPNFASLPSFPSNLQRPNLSPPDFCTGQPVQSRAYSPDVQRRYQQAQFQSRQQTFQSNGPQIAAANHVQAVYNGNWSVQRQVYQTPPKRYVQRGSPYSPSGHNLSNQNIVTDVRAQSPRQPFLSSPTNQGPAARDQFPDAASLAVAALNLFKAQAVPVHHCADSWGLVIHHADGWSLVYSGDTRPTRPLIEAGRGCTLLIHEATFEGKLLEHAKRKRHSTTEEALDVAAQMGAQRTILTHFSQRYPKAVEFESDLPSADTTCIAFDGMVVPFSELARLPSLLEPMTLALADEEKEIEREMPDGRPQDHSDALQPAVS